MYFHAPLHIAYRLSSTAISSILLLSSPVNTFLRATHISPNVMFYFTRYFTAFQNLDGFPSGCETSKHHSHVPDVHFFFYFQHSHRLLVHGRSLERLPHPGDFEATRQQLSLLCA